MASAAPHQLLPSYERTDYGPAFTTSRADDKSLKSSNDLLPIVFRDDGFLRSPHCLGMWIIDADGDSHPQNLLPHERIGAAAAVTGTAGNSQ